MLGIKREFSLVMHKLLNCHQMIIKCGDSGWKWGRWRGKGRWRIVWASLLAPFEGLSWMLYVWKLLPQTLQVYLCLAASSLNSGSSMAAKRAIYVSEQYVVSYLILFWSIQNLLSKEFCHWKILHYLWHPQDVPIANLSYNFNMRLSKYYLLANMQPGSANTPLWNFLSTSCPTPAVSALDTIISFQHIFLCIFSIYSVLQQQ